MDYDQYLNWSEYYLFQEALGEVIDIRSITRDLSDESDSQQTSASQQTPMGSSKDLLGATGGMHAAGVGGTRSRATKKETALHISVGKEETGPVSSRRRATVPELDLVEADSDTWQPSSEGLQKG